MLVGGLNYSTGVWESYRYPKRRSIAVEHQRPYHHDSLGVGARLGFTLAEEEAGVSVLFQAKGEDTAENSLT